MRGMAGIATLTATLGLSACDSPTPPDAPSWQVDVMPLLGPKVDA